MEQRKVTKIIIRKLILMKVTLMSLRQNERVKERAQLVMDELSSG